MTTPEPPAEPEPRPISEIIEQIMIRHDGLSPAEAQGHASGASETWFVLEKHGVPVSVSGPYSQAEPEASPAPAGEDAYRAADEAYGPHWPTLAELWAAQDAPLAAHEAGCSEAEYDRLLEERHQTEAAYLEASDQELARAREAEADYFEPEAEPEAEP